MEEGARAGDCTSGDLISFRYQRNGESMSIQWSNWTLADSSFVHASGRKMLGNYGLRLAVRYDTHVWRQQGPVPMIILTSSAVTLIKPTSIFAGFGIPESTSPFQITQYANRTEVVFDVALSPGAMQEIETARNGAGLDLNLRINGVITCGPDSARADDLIHICINQSDWLRVLDECGFGKTLLFEIPLNIEVVSDAELVATEFESARRHLNLGHYQEVVAACRRAIERLNQCLGHDGTLATARSVKGDGKRSLTIFERELLIRGTAMDFASLAHHADHVQARPFDRLDATMMLGLTAALANTALGRAQSREL